jgi:translation initiation factor IF-1
LSEREVLGSIVDLGMNRMYSVRLEGGEVVSAHVGNDLQMRIVRLLKGDRVVVELGENDPSRGRIVRRIKTR